MGWAIGYDSRRNRDFGYAVPAYCDHPECREEIDRGLAYACGGDQMGGAHGCGLHFCDAHLPGPNQTCECCRDNKPPFEQKTDHPDWTEYKLSHDSWAQWREDNPEEVERLRAELVAKAEAK